MTQIEPGPSENKTASDAEPLGHLYKMSPTAGVATTDYASINSTAIVAMVVGAASILALLNPYMLFIPSAGLICGIIAIRQIRNSNGTQVGRGLAWGGLLLSLLLGGGVTTVQVTRTLLRQSAQRDIAAKIETLGQQIHDGQYEAIYDQASPRLRTKIPRDLFLREISSMNVVPQLGKLEYLRWNKEPMQFELNPDSGVQQAAAMSLEKFEKLPDPGRELITFVNEGGKWSLFGIPRLLGGETPKGAAGAGGPK